MILYRYILSEALECCFEHPTLHVIAEQANC